MCVCVCGWWSIWGSVAKMHWDLLGFFLRFYLFIFRERGREIGGEGEKHQCEKRLHTPWPDTEPATEACALDRGLNRWPFTLREGTQPPEPHRSGLGLTFKEWSDEIQERSLETHEDKWIRLQTLYLCKAPCWVNTCGETLLKGS